MWQTVIFFTWSGELLLSSWKTPENHSSLGSLKSNLSSLESVCNWVWESKIFCKNGGSDLKRTSNFSENTLASFYLKNCTARKWLVRWLEHGLIAVLQSDSDWRYKSRDSLNSEDKASCTPYSTALATHEMGIVII